METKAFLKQVEMFNGLPDDALKDIAALCTVQSFSPGEVIIARNSPPDFFYLVEDGTVEVNTAPKPDTPPADAVMVSLGSGQSFGEMGLVDKGLRSATVTAATNVTVHKIACDAFLDLCEKNPYVGFKVMHNIAADLSFKLRYRNLI